MKYIKILAPLLVALFCTSACSVKNDTLNVMGYNYLFGVGTEKDYAKAVECFRIAAEDGHAGAQNHLAYCYDNGFGVEQDYVEPGADVYFDNYASVTLDLNGHHLLWLRTTLAIVIFSGKGLSKTTREQ